MQHRSVNKNDELLVVYSICESLCIPLSPPPPSPDDLDQFETECEDLFLHFQHRNLEALVAAVRTTLDTLRRRITTRY